MVGGRGTSLGVLKARKFENSTVVLSIEPKSSFIRSGLDLEAPRVCCLVSGSDRVVSGFSEPSDEMVTLLWAFFPSGLTASEVPLEGLLRSRLSVGVATPSGNGGDGGW